MNRQPTSQIETSWKHPYQQDFPITEPAR